MKIFKSLRARKVKDRGESSESKRTKAQTSSLTTPATLPRDLSKSPQSAQKEQASLQIAGNSAVYFGAEKQPRKDLWLAAFEQLESSKKEVLESLLPTSGQAHTSRNAVGLVIRETEQAYETYKSKGWHIRRRNGKDDINVRDEAKKILSAALAFKSLIGSAVAFDPTGHASTAWTVVLFGLQLVQNDQDRIETLFKSSAFLANLLARYANIETHYLDQSIKDVDRLEMAIIDVYVAILEYSVAVKTSSDQKAFKRTVVAVQALTGQPLQSLQSSVVAKDQEVEAWRNLLSHQYRQNEFEENNKKADLILGELDRITTDVSAIKKTILTQDEERILEWVSSINVSDSFHRSLALREADTGRWLLTSPEYSDWRSSPKTFLWLYAVSGCGKTVLCTTIIEDMMTYCTASGNVLAYWYFDFNDIAKQKIDNFLNSLIRQLSAAAVEFPAEVTDLAREFMGSGRFPGTRRLASCLDSVIKSFDQEVFIVIDALDECPEKTDFARRRDLLDQVRDILLVEHRNLHLLATSRKENDIHEQVQNLVTGSVDIESSFRSDIELFVKNSLIELPRLARWNVEIKAKIITRLVQVGEPRFRWAALQVEALQDCNDETEIHETLRTIPQTLEQSYQRSLSHIPRKDQNRARTILTWLIYSSRPLTLVEVAAAAGLPFPDDVIRICTSSLIAISKIEDWFYEGPGGEIVRLAHSSVQEYLLSERIQGLSTEVSFHMSPQIGHARIGLQCVAELLKLDCDLNATYATKLDEAREKPKSSDETHKEHGSSKMDTNSAKSDESPWEDRFPPNIQNLLDQNQLLYYAVFNWYKHAERSQPAENTEQEQLVLAIHEFFSEEENLSYYNHYQGQHYILSKQYQDYKPISVRPPLTYASTGGMIDSVHKLIRRNVDLDRIVDDGVVRGTALMEALASGHTDIVRLLLDSGADANCFLYEDYIPLCWACEHDRYEVIPYLLAAGADPNLGRPLNVACCFRNEHTHATISQLLVAGAEVNPSDWPTPLAIVCFVDQPEEIIRLLLDAGADASIFEGHGSILTMRSVIKAVRHELMPRHFELGVRSDDPDWGGRTLLRWVRRGDFPTKQQMIRTLLETKGVEESENEEWIDEFGDLDL